MSALTTEALKSGLRRVAAELEASADDLNAADAKLGDGDLGVTMQRGARGLMEEVDALPADVGMALMKCAQAFTRISGSSYGTLLATGLMSAAKACKGREAVPWSETSALVGGAIEAMIARGKGALGEKTVLDALEEVRKATDGVEDSAALLEAAERGVTKALNDFRDQPAKQGRARMFGDKSIGLDDPGMLALECLIDGLRS